MDKDAVQRDLKAFYRKMPSEKGKINLEKLAVLYKKYKGHDISVSLLENKFQEVEKDRNGATTLESFMDIFGKIFGVFEEAEMELTPGQREIILKIFKICDYRGTGKIDKDGLKQGMDAFGTKMDDSQIDMLYTLLDPTELGYIEYNTFIKGMVPYLQSTDADGEEAIRQNLHEVFQKKKKKKFEKIFLKKKNTMNSSEIEKALNEFSVSLTPDEIKELMKQVPSNDEVGFDKFYGMMDNLEKQKKVKVDLKGAKAKEYKQPAHRKLHKQQSWEKITEGEEQRIENVFGHYDVNKDGYLSKAVMLKAVKENALGGGRNLKDDSLEKIFENNKILDNEGNADFEHFKKACAYLSYYHSNDKKHAVNEVVTPSGHFTSVSEVDSGSSFINLDSVKRNSVISQTASLDALKKTHEVLQSQLDDAEMKLRNVEEEKKQTNYRSCKHKERISSFRRCKSTTQFTCYSI